MTAFALVGAAGVAIAQVDDGETIYACAKHNNGNLRIVEGPDDGLKSEYPLRGCLTSRTRWAGGTARDLREHWTDVPGR